MKRLVFLLAVTCMVCRSVPADPFRYEWRQANGHSTGLQPLFDWWKHVKGMQTTTLDLNTTATNDFITVISQAWKQLPPKPAPDWCLIRSSKVSSAGQYWEVKEAEVYLAPNIYRHSDILLMNPPNTEYQMFYTCKNDVTALDRQHAALSSKTNAAQTSLNQAKAGETGHRINREKMNANVSADSARLNDLTAQAGDIKEQIRTMSEYLDHFPSQTAYTLEHFARDTGKKANGLEIYDLGLAQGLNY